ncbi:MAG: hypothetical protein AAFY10_11110 [Pseudomonadota bacterium]
MGGFSATAFSVLAVLLSSLTTYLTFFDARYTVSAAVAKVEVQVQTSGGASDGRKNVSYRYFPTASVILSNRGTRPVVISEIDIVRSESIEDCQAGEKTAVYGFEPLIIEPGTVASFDLEFQLPAITAEGPMETQLDLDEEVALWCAAWVAFDPNGYRREPVTPFVTITRGFTPAADGERYPKASVILDYPRQPETIVSKGLF